MWKSRDSLLNLVPQEAVSSFTNQCWNRNSGAKCNNHFCYKYSWMIISFVVLPNYNQHYRTLSSMSVFKTIGTVVTIIVCWNNLRLWNCQMTKGSSELSTMHPANNGNGKWKESDIGNVLILKEVCLRRELSERGKVDSHNAPWCSEWAVNRNLWLCAI